MNMKIINIFLMALLTVEIASARCTPDGLEECITLREQANRYMQQAAIFEKQQLYGDAANSYLSAKARYLLSAKKSGNGFFSDAEEDRKRAEEAGINYARVDELAVEQEQAEEAAAAKKKPKAKSKRNIASITVPAGYANLGNEEPEFEN